LLLKTQAAVRKTSVGNGINNVPSDIAKRLLADIFAIMKDKNRSKMRSKHILLHLCSNVRKPWATFCGGKKLHYHRLSAMLREFGIHSKDMRFNNKSFKGYQREWFVEAAKRVASKRNSKIQ
jgi:hypothetical protein